MELEKYFPKWDKLTKAQQALVESTAIRKSAKAGDMLHSGSLDCVGFIVVGSGQLRAFILSDEGKEVTLYRLFEMDACLFSASCIVQSIQFDIMIQAEKDSEIWVIPSKVYKSLMDESVDIANYTSQLMAIRFSEVMWLIEQIMWKSFDKRLAAFLLEESAIEDSDVLKLTHDKIANHLGTAREVVTRMLKYFQSEGMVSLARGTVEISDMERLSEIAE